MVKNCEMSEILLYLQANKSACHSFLDVCRRQESLESETKESLLVTAIEWPEYQHLCCVPEPHPHRLMYREPVMSARVLGYITGLESWTLKEWHICYIGQQTNVPFALKGDTVSIFQGYLLYMRQQIFCKGTDSKYVRLCRPYGFCCNYSTVVIVV